MKYKLNLIQDGEIEVFDDFEELKEYLSDWLSEWGECMPTVETMYKIKKAKGTKKLMRIIKSNIDLANSVEVKSFKIDKA